MSDTTTIVARASAAGSGGVAVVRLSGPQVPAMMVALCGQELPPRQAVLTSFTGPRQTTIDEGIALYFPAPHSYTGEHVLELQCHGSMVIVGQLIDAALALGAQLAQPGEFTQRAFLNGRFDLLQAEAVADLIASSTQAAARAAQRSLQGVFSDQVEALAEQMLSLRVYVESAIDFPDEEIDFLNQGDVRERLDGLIRALEHLLQQAGQGVILRDGLNLVLAGPPNVGKSSLLNRLAGRETAIVSAQPGTTRDVLREHLDIDGLPVHVYDTAGLREGGGDIEQEGMRRARALMQQADHILLMREVGEGAQALPTGLPKDVAVTEVINKIDLADQEAALSRDGDRTRIRLSAKTGVGVDLLSQRLRELAGMASTQEGNFSARQRHLEALQQALQHLQRGSQELADTQSGELLAEELRLGHYQLGRLTGTVTSDDLLGEIFSSFCIGK